MNSNDLLDLIGQARTNYIQQALDTRSAASAVKTHAPKRRALMIAAAIAVALLLVGCAVAVVATLQNRKIGETTREKYFDSQGNRITPTEVTVDIINLHGAKDTPQYKAMQEWEAWNETYTPDPAQVSCGNDQGVPDNLYGVYSCDTMEMADKLTQILDKYGLKPLDTGFGINEETVKNFCEAYSIDGICHEDRVAKVEKLAGWGYTCGAMDFEWNITPAGGREILVTIKYTPKDYFAPGGYTVMEIGEFEQWGYTTADGSPVQLALGPDRAYIFREQENANIYVALSGDADAPFTREELEQFADIINFQVSPQPPADPEGFKAQMREEYDRYLAEKTAPLPEVWEAHSFGNYADFLKEYYREYVPNDYYALWDVDGDGVEELLTGNRQGDFYDAKTIANGKVVDYNAYNGPFHVCENGVLVSDEKMFFSHSRIYVMPLPQECRILDRIEYRLNEDQWYDRKEKQPWDATPITQAEAEAIQAKYSPIQIPVSPLKDYPIDDQGTTLESCITRNVKFATEEETLELYRAFLEKEGYTHYRLQDLTGDGIPELFAGREADRFNNVKTVVNGKVWHVTITDSQFCEGGIYCELSQTDWQDSYEFWKVEEGQFVLVDLIAYMAEADQWGRSADGDYGLDEVLTPEEAHAIVDSYITITGCMKPISDFPAK